jgi:sec-independent protein translocase protein TatC
MNTKTDEETKGIKEMSFLEHLEVLRWHLIRSALAIIILAVVAFIFNDFVFNSIILAPKSPKFITNDLLCRFGNFLNMKSLCINNKPFQIININMAGQFSTHIMVSLMAGLIVAFPYIFWEIWSFVKPALHTKEKSHTRGAVFFTSFLFIIGVFFGYFIILPLSVHFFGTYSVSSQVVNQINLTSFISTTSSCVLASGIVFELPVIIYFLSKVGLITPNFLRRYRRHAIVVILTIAAIITPPDVFSQILVSLPLLLLYEISILISKRVAAKDKSMVL